jgi:hypothetical protein
MHVECNFYTQSMILHVEYAFFTHESKFDTYACECECEGDFYTLECDSYTQSVINTRNHIYTINMTLTSVITTRTRVIYTRTRLIYTRIVQFPHAM